MKIRKILSAVADIAALFLFVYLLAFPEYATEATRSALVFCGKTLIPSLFIYMILSKMLITHPLADRLMQKLGCSPIMLLAGMLCGAPVGAKNAVSLYESGRITKKHAEYLISFTNNASVSFIIGFFGVELSGNIVSGFKLLTFQLLGSLIAAAAMKRVMFGKEKLPKCRFGNGRRVGLREAVSDSAFTMLTLCACAVFFIVVSGVVAKTASLSAEGEAIVRSALEFSSGCASAAVCGKNAFLISAFAVGCGGLSVALQVKSVITNRLSFRPYIAGKAISCAVTVAAAFIFG